MGLLDKFRHKNDHEQPEVIDRHDHPKTIRIDPPIYDHTSEEIKPRTRTEVAVVRKVGIDKPVVDNTLLPIIIMGNGIGGDPQTLLIQYPKRHMYSTVRALVARYRHKNAESFIDTWRNVDVFVDVGRATNPHDRSQLRGYNWLRIAYECLEDNPNPGAKFKGATIVRIVEEVDAPKQLDGSPLTLDTIIGR